MRQNPVLYTKRSKYIFITHAVNSESSDRKDRYFRDNIFIFSFLYANPYIVIQITFSYFFPIAQFIASIQSPGVELATLSEPAVY